MVLIAAMYGPCNSFMHIYSANETATVDREAGADVLHDIRCIIINGREIKMITHIVLFRLKERTPEGIETAKAKLLSMEGKVEMLRHLEVGVDLIHSERSADIALFTKFDSMADLQAYQVHPYHANEVAAYMKSVSSAVMTADYEA